MIMKALGGYMAPPPPEPDDRFMTDLGIRQVILLPSLDVCLARSRARSRRPFLKDSDLRTNYEDFTSSVRASDRERVIDNGALTVDETVDAMVAVLQSDQF